MVSKDDACYRPFLLIFSHYNAKFVTYPQPPDHYLDQNERRQIWNQCPQIDYI